MTKEQQPLTLNFSSCLKRNPASLITPKAVQLDLNSLRCTGKVLGLEEVFLRCPFKHFPFVIA